MNQNTKIVIVSSSVIITVLSVYLLYRHFHIVSNKEEAIKTITKRNTGIYPDVLHTLDSVWVITWGNAVFHGQGYFDYKGKRYDTISGNEIIIQ